MPLENMQNMLAQFDALQEAVAANMIRFGSAGHA
jgi:hypothetical protein